VQSAFTYCTLLKLLDMCVCVCARARAHAHARALIYIIVAPTS